MRNFRTEEAVGREEEEEGWEEVGGGAWEEGVGGDSWEYTGIRREGGGRREERGGGRRGRGGGSGLGKEGEGEEGGGRGQGEIEGEGGEEVEGMGGGGERGEIEGEEMERGREIDIDFLRREFALFYRNRLSSQSQQTFKSKIPVLSHKPKILEKSRILGEKYRERFGNSSDFLGFVEIFCKKKEINKSKSIKLKTEEDMRECSFKPVLLKQDQNDERDRSRVERLAIPKIRENDRGKEEIEFEREKEECTFKPNVYTKRRNRGSRIFHHFS